MRKLYHYFLLSLALAVISCTNSNVSTFYENQIDSLTNVINNQALLIKQMSDSLTVYKYPADQRFIQINTLFSEEKYQDAKSE